MSFSSAGYIEDQIKILEDALDRACEKLGVSNSDRENREEVARAILALSNAGQLDLEPLVRYATDRCFALRMGI